MANQAVIERFRKDIGSVTCTTDERQLRMKSRDFYWYSPILTAQLQSCRADVVVQPQSEEEIERVSAAAARHRMPLTVRGGGTGNYGQSVPLNDATPGDWVTLTPTAGTTNYTFNVRRIDLNQGVTVPIVAVDACGGDWRSFVGAGVDAFK